MPEGSEGGYQSSAEELQAGQENLEAVGIREEPTEKGIQHVDRLGDVVDRTETWDDGNKQVIQYTYLEGGAGLERSKIIEGPKKGYELQREHPMTVHDVFVQWEDEDIEGFVSDTVQAMLINMAHTTAGAATRESWSHFEVTDPAVLKVFAGFKRPAGALDASQQGHLGQRFEITVGGRQVVFENIDKISANFGSDGLPTKVVFHSRSWSEAPKREKIQGE